MLAFLLLLLLAAVPAPQDMSKIPDVSGPSMFGEITQLGADVSIQGHPSWEAVGEVTEKELLVTWTSLASGRTAIGRYNVNGDGSIVGRWHYADEPNVPENLRDETIRYKAIEKKIN